MIQDELVLEYRCVPSNKILTLAGDKKHWRRKKIIQLSLKGLTQNQIAQKLGFCLSTVEKDIRAIRNNCRIKEVKNFK